MSNDENDNVIQVNFGAARAPEPESESAAVDEVPVDPAAAQKHEAFARLIEVGTVMITLDARVPGVLVPGAFEGDLQLNLNFCHEFRIPDFDFDQNGVRASLSFSGRDHWCDIPWFAVYMMRSHENGDVMVFPSSLPEEIKAMLPEAQAHLDSLDSEEE